MAHRFPFSNRGRRVSGFESGDTPHGLKPGGFLGEPKFHGRALSRATEGAGSALRLVSAASTQNLLAKDTILDVTDKSPEW